MKAKVRLVLGLLALLATALVVADAVRYARSLPLAAVPMYAPRADDPSITFVGIDTGVGQGTGALVADAGDGVVLTAAHVLRPFESGQVSLRVPGVRGTLPGWIVSFAPGGQDAAAIYAPELAVYGRPAPLAIPNTAARAQGFWSYSVACVRAPSWQAVEYPLAAGAPSRAWQPGSTLPGCSGGPVLGYARSPSTRGGDPANTMYALGILSTADLSTTTGWQQLHYVDLTSPTMREWFRSLPDAIRRLNLPPVPPRETLALAQRIGPSLAVTSLSALSAMEDAGAVAGGIVTGTLLVVIAAVAVAAVVNAADVRRARRWFKARGVALPDPPPRTPDEWRAAYAAALRTIYRGEGEDGSATATEHPA